MIKRITVDAPYCFGNQPLVLEGLAKVNFVFAPNGSGKTTISNALMGQPDDPVERSKWPVAPTDLRIRVFNDKYREQVLVERVPGVFTVGLESAEVNEQIAALEEAQKARKAERQGWEREIGSGDPEGRSGLRGGIEDERDIFRDTVFEEHKKKPEGARDLVFEGFRSVKVNFRDEVLRRASGSPAAPVGVTWEALEKRAASLAGGGTLRSVLPALTTISLVEEADIARLAQTTETRGTGTFAEFIKRLGHQDWVGKGRDHLEPAEGKCPFCQQAAPEDLEQELAAYFATGYDQALEEAQAVEARVAARAATLESELAAIEQAASEDTEVSEDALESAIDSVRTAARLIQEETRTKCEHPTQAAEVTDIGATAAALSSLIASENSAIAAHNALIADAKASRGRLVEDGWALFLSESAVANAVKRFLGAKASKETQIAGLRENIVKNERLDGEASQEIERLRGSISNTTQVADRINGLLEAMGFLNFRLDVAAGDSVVGGYRIVRKDGASAADTLSEGEKSFIAFTHFWESLTGSSAAGGSPEEVVAVIDDPISSLDSDSLYAVAARIRDAAVDAVAGGSNVRQLVIMTHNTQFHREAAFTPNDGKLADRHYFRLRKNLSGVTVVDDDRNRDRVQGTYHRLWGAIVDAARDAAEGDLTPVGLENVARRIIEWYFRTLGGIPSHERPGDLAPEDDHVISMFHTWANAGSHTIVDDVDQTVHLGGTLQFLKLLRRYFDLMSHSSHFEMMVRSVGGETLLADGAVLAQTPSASDASTAGVPA